MVSVPNKCTNITTKIKQKNPCHTAESKSAPLAPQSYDCFVRTQATKLFNVVHASINKTGGKTLQQRSYTF